MARNIKEEVFYFSNVANDWIQLDNVVYPIHRELSLNEEFDYVSLKFYDTEHNILQPKDKVQIRTRSYDNDFSSNMKEKIEKYIVHEDVINQASLASGNEYYEHNLRLVEMTQILEGYTIENKSFSRTIDISRLPVFPTYNPWAYSASTFHWYGKIFMKDISMIYENYGLNQTYTLPNAIESWQEGLPDGTEYESELNYTIEITEPDATVTTLQANDRTYTFNQVGSYTITYVAGYVYEQVGDDYGPATMVFDNIYVDPIKAPYTIKQVIEGIFETVEPLVLGETPEFVLTTDTDILNRLSIYAPEFFFFNMSLWDALLEVSRFIMAIPRVINYNEITFDFVGEVNETVDSTGYVSQTIYQNESQYITKVESDLENIIVDSIEEQSSITIPYNVASTIKLSSVEISADTAVFKLDGPPIYKIKDFKVYVDWTIIDATNYYNVDIQTGEDEELDLAPFIIEKGLWDALPNTGPGKGLFLYYSQGKSDIIDGLSYQTPEWWFLNAEEKTISRLISVLLANKLGLDVNVELEEPNSNVIMTNNIKDIVFSAKYIPYMGQRVKVNRTNMEDFNNEVSKFMNQTTRQLDSESFGLYIKGILDRQGNKNFNRTYYYGDHDLIPNPGSNDANNYFSTKVSTETWPTYIKTSVEYTKDYNKQTEFVGLDQKYRQFQIPTQNVSTRTINYEEYAIVGKQSDMLGVENSSLTAEGIKVFSGLFNTTDTTYAWSNAVLNGTGIRAIADDVQIYFDKSDTDTYTENVADVRLHKSIMSYHLGNSLLMTFSMTDNFSAGERSIYQSTTKNRLEQITYGDNIYSTAYLFKIKTYPKFDTSTLAKARLYPEATTGDAINNTALVDLDLIVNKDTRDAITFTYQLSGIAASNDIIIGPGFAKYNPLVNGAPDYTKLRFITVQDTTIGPHTKYVDTDNGVIDPNVTLNITVNAQGQLDIKPYEDNNNSTYNGLASKAWALYHPDTKELVLAVNEDFGAGSNPSNLTIYFRRKKRELSTDWSLAL